MKCLSVWWNSAPSSNQSIEERILKARTTFFSHGQLCAYHGKLNPLSSRSIVEICVLPVLLYRSESWILNLTLLSKLESFQSKRILQLSKHTSNNVPVLALKWPSMCGRILCNKLSFLYCVQNGDVHSISVNKQCKFLDEVLGTNFTEELLSNPHLSLKDLKRRIISADYLKNLKAAEDHPSQKYVAQIEEMNVWLKLWDMALDHGTEGTKAVLAILKALCRSVFSD